MRKRRVTTQIPEELERRLTGAFSTIENAYAQIITSMTLSAQDHVNISDTLTSQVIDVLKSVEKRGEETKKKVRFNPLEIASALDISDAFHIANCILPEIAI